MAKRRSVLSAREVLAIRRLAAKKTLSCREIGAYFGVSSGTVSFWVRTMHLPGDLPPVPPSSKRSDIIRRRRALISKLCGEITVRNDRKTPKYGSTTALIAAIKLQTGQTLAATTIRRDLHKMGFVSRVRLRVPSTLAADYERRLEFCNRIVTLCPQKLIFSDEKFFNSNDHTQRRQWVRKGSKTLPRESSRWPSRVMVWGAIGAGYRHMVVVKEMSANSIENKQKRAKRALRVNEKPGWKMQDTWYIRNCLSGNLVRHCVGQKKIFMQDGAACHTSRKTKAYLRNQGVKVLEEWPARSPDLNPIETLWAILQPRVSAGNARNASELTQLIIKEWNAVSQSTIDALVMSFGTRVDEVRAAKGAPRS